MPLAIETADPRVRNSGHSSRGLVALGATVVLGVVLVAANDPLARIAARALPWRGEVSSAGTAFPSFAEIAPEIIARNGVILVVLPVGIAGVALIERFRATPIDRFAAVAVVGGTGALTWWLAIPHNGFPSNARIHWVDYLTDESDNFFYAAGRVPHLVFYENPPLWQGINAAIICALCLAICRRLGFGWLTSSLLATVVLVSGNVTRFSNTAEDVFINLALVLVVILQVLARRPLATGAALALLILGRPQFAIVAIALVVAEVVAAWRADGRVGADTLRHLGKIAAAATTGVVLSQALFTVIGRRYFLTNGNWVDIEELADVEAREIDGFTIFPLSGAYALHFLWVLPALVLVLAGVSVICARHWDRAREVTVYFCAGSVLLLLALHELRPLLYFNIRYLTYLTPFLFVMTWALASAQPRSTDTTGVLHRRNVVIALAVLAPLSIPSDAVGLKRKLERRPEVQLLEVREELRELAADRTVVLDFPALSSRNYVAYVLRRPVADVQLVAEHGLDDESVLIAPTTSALVDGEGVRSDQIVLRTPSLLVVDLERGSS